jgi:hypothetical protein
LVVQFLVILEMNHYWLVVERHFPLDPASIIWPWLEKRFAYSWIPFDFFSGTSW